LPVFTTRLFVATPRARVYYIGYCARFAFPFVAVILRLRLNVLPFPRYCYAFCRSLIGLFRCAVVTVATPRTVYTVRGLPRLVTAHVYLTVAFAFTVCALVAVGCAAD